MTRVVIRRALAAGIGLMGYALFKYIADRYEREVCDDSFVLGMLKGQMYTFLFIGCASNITYVIHFMTK